MTRVQDAVLHLLCFGTTTYDRVADYPGRNGVGGLFSQLNFLAQEVLERLYQGRAPATTWHSATKLHGYGEGALADYFAPIHCPLQAPMASVDEAVAALAKAPRHQVVSHLLHALYTPRRSLLMPSGSSSQQPQQLDLAMHVRRGDRITEQRPAEKIVIWDEPALLKEAAKHIPLGKRGTILVASDDDAFSRSVARALEGAGHTAIRLGNDHQTFDAQNRSVEAARVCTAACVPPLISLVAHFSRARTLMLSTKSNLGSFLLSWWFAANVQDANVLDAMPGFVDLDHVVTSTSTFSKQRKYFCELQWGSRRGLCKSNQSTCELAAFAQRSFCAPAGSKAGGGAKGGGGGAKGKGKGTGKPKRLV